MSNGLISIILPTYNRKLQFNKALQSVLTQEYENWELIVINDGKEDIGQYIPSDKRIRYIKNHSNLGAPASRNIGIKASTGCIIAYLDDDDEWLSNHLSMSSDIFKKYDFIYSGTKVRKGNQIISWYNEGFSYKKLAERNFITTPSVMHRKSILNKSGYWNERLKCLQDWDLWCRIALRTDRIFYRNDVTVIINWSVSSITSMSTDNNIRKKVISYIKLKYYFPLLLKHIFKGKNL